jgi:hypothetical protein
MKTNSDNLKNFNTTDPLEPPMTPTFLHLMNILLQTYPHPIDAKNTFHDLLIAAHMLDDRLRSLEFMLMDIRSYLYMKTEICAAE